MAAPKMSDFDQAPVGNIHLKALIVRSFPRLPALFKTTRGYFLKATKPCVVTYGALRIGRLVQLDLGLYR